MNRRQVLKSTGVLASTALLSPVADLFAISPSQKPAPFRINYGKDRIADLHRRIDNMIWPEMPFDTGWSAGTNAKVLRDLVRYWRHEYDWFKQQQKLNQLPHYTLPIEGEIIHFLHFKGNGKRQPFPLLLLHGWPSSFLEFITAAPMLLKQGYDLVVPSLPGFVFSNIPQKEGSHPSKMAEQIHKLMQSLNYERYGIAGGDWGAVISRAIVRLFPSSVVGQHRVSINVRALGPNEKLTDQEQTILTAHANFVKTETAYGQIQSTKPQTLAYAMQDSPVGLLAWILEKYWAWTDHGDNLWDGLNKDTILTTVMLYWLTGRVYSSFRIYYESRLWTESNTNLPPEKVDVPVGWTSYPKDPFTIRTSIRSLGDTNSYNIIHHVQQPRGGHFPSLEQPELWAQDVSTFFSRLSQRAKK